MRAWLEARHLNEVLGVTAPSRLCTGAAREWAATVVARLPATAGPRHRGGAGSPGERGDAWARIPRRPLNTVRQRWLGARRHVSAPPKLAYDVASGPPATPLAALARGAGRRWAIEERVKPANGEGGLAQSAVRSWPGW